MIKKDILITVVDGQGGGIGRQYIESLTKQLPKNLPVIVRDPKPRGNGLQDRKTRHFYRPGQKADICPTFVHQR